MEWDICSHIFLIYTCVTQCFSGETPSVKMRNLRGAMLTEQHRWLQSPHSIQSPPSINSSSSIQSPHSINSSSSIQSLPSIKSRQLSGCYFKGKHYPSGPVQLPDCVTCHCDTRSGNVSCGVTNCPAMPDCLLIQNHTESGQCCPACLQRGCWYKGKGYKPGTRIPDTGPCSVCYCPWTGQANGQPTCMEVKCANASCVDAEIPHGKCCPVCKRGPNCWLGDLVISAANEVWIGPCRSCKCPTEEQISAKTSHIHGKHAICNWHQDCYG